MERDWENLPKNLLDSVVEKLLTPSDYLGFTLVCRTWYSVAKDNRSKEAAVKAKRLPLVVFYTGRKDYWKLYNVVDRKVLDFQVRMPNVGLVGSSKGWLMFAHRNVAAKTFGVTLVNPFLRVRGRKPKEKSLIVLPPLTPPGWEKWYQKYWKFIINGTISADPILDANNCIVVVSHLERSTVAFLRLGKDETWTYVRDGFGDNGDVPRCYLIDEVINDGNTFYTVNQWCELLSFDVTPQSHSDVKLVGGNIPTTHSIKRYIVRGEDDKLFMVHRFIKFTFDYTSEDRRTSYEFRVFEFDFQTDKWIEKRTLGDVALFIGYNSSICLPASNIFGFKSNCIYFNHDRDDVGTWYAAYDFGLYNYEDKSFLETYTKEAMDLLRLSYPLPTWVLPTINFPL